MSRYPSLTADEAADLISHDATIGISGFTPAGSAKAIPRAIAVRACSARDQGHPFRLRLLTGASTGAAVDDSLAEADALAWRAPFQTSRSLRGRINEGATDFVDLHLSSVAQLLEQGFFPDLDVAIVEATDVLDDGRVYLTTSSGIAPSILRHAKKVIIERNCAHHPKVSEMHDTYILPPPPHRSPISMTHPMARIGVPYASVDPVRVIGIVETNETDGCVAGRPAGEVERAIAANIVDFLVDEMRAGRIPDSFLPVQAGVGNVANAVIECMGADERIPPFEMFTEVLQDSQVDLLASGAIKGVSTSAIAVSDIYMKKIYSDIDAYMDKIVIRPVEVSNNPELIRRFGVIAINTALEFDVFGCANSTHVNGTHLMNGIGGSGDFTRNATLSIMVAPSVAKGGAISSVVPMCSHVDHTDHDVQVFVTDQGLADVRATGPRERSSRIINSCAHPQFRHDLRHYVSKRDRGHMPHNLTDAFSFHLRMQSAGTMISPGEGTE